MFCVRLRVRFSKLGKVRWTSQRDVARIWERAIRRAGLPVAYSKGFSPRPLLSFGLGLPTGCESTAEYLDMVMEHPVDQGGLAPELSALLPGGIDVLALAEVAGDAGSLQQDVTSCTWEMAVAEASDGELAERIASALAAESLPFVRERKGREQSADLRPAIVSLEQYRSDGCRAVLVAELSTRPLGVRPVELASTLGVKSSSTRRTHQWIDHGGAREEPLPLDAPNGARLEACAP